MSKGGISYFNKGENYALMAFHNTTNTSKASSRKSKVAKEPVYPFFLECAKEVNDSYWELVYQKMAMNKMPRRFSFNGVMLSHKKGGTVMSVDVPNVVSKAIQVCNSFFTTYGGMFSDIDAEKNIKERAQCSVAKPQQWTKVRKRMKDVLITIYVNDLAEKYSLSSNEKIRLITLVNVAVITKVFNKDNIILKDGLISEIKGLVYENGTFSVDESITGKEKKAIDFKGKDLVASPPVLMPHINTDWEKMLLIMRSRNQKGSETIFLEETPQMETSETSET